MSNSELIDCPALFRHWKTALLLSGEAAARCTKQFSIRRQKPTAPNPETINQSSWALSFGICVLNFLTLFNVLRPVQVPTPLAFDFSIDHWAHHNEHSIKFIFNNSRIMVIIQSQQWFGVPMMDGIAPIARATNSARFLYFYFNFSTETKC